MTGSELCAALGEEYGLTQKQARKVVDAICDTIAQGLADGQRIELRGFGSFRVKQQDAYKGRNPRTGEPVKVPQKHHIRFKAGKTIFARVNTPD
ncbi:HU family DNA-binding protein [Ruegeria sp.]|uniref:HU family DNA-binding protein n=1 Tax=Ruegeria sp. TaxID=1879320 RepID=UPI003B00BC3C